MLLSYVMRCQDCGAAVPHYNLSKKLCGKCNYQRYGAISRKNQGRYREAAIDHYGRCCTYCGSIKDLQIDHKEGNGKSHRNTTDTRRIWKDIVTEGFPDSFQVTCRRCNHAKSNMTDAEFRAWIEQVFFFTHQ